MEFKLSRQGNNKRLGEVITSHGSFHTPIFMPVGTVGTVKGVKPSELKNMGARIILGNTYHLYLRPGTQLLKKFGGLHNFMGWNLPILTDSGGYQVFSLGRFENSIENEISGGSLVKITENGAIFNSHIDGSKHLFTPEKVIDIQLSIGSDIMMPLDFCPSAEATDREIEKAVDITNLWFERTWKYWEKKRKELNSAAGLFAIVQGGANNRLRKKSFDFLNQFPVDGFSIGGVANAGESKLKQKKALEYTIPLLPEDKPRYLMGVGEPEDMIYAVGKGVDMFDCVLPTRLARHGVAWVKEGGAYVKIDFRKSSTKEDKSPLSTNCACSACSNFSKAYIHHLIKAKEILGIRLLTEHNLQVVLDMFNELRGGL